MVRQIDLFLQTTAEATRTNTMQNTGGVRVYVSMWYMAKVKWAPGPFQVVLSIGPASGVGPTVGPRVW
jgi:hypothetical protein